MPVHTQTPGPSASTPRGHRDPKMALCFCPEGSEALLVLMSLREDLTLPSCPSGTGHLLPAPQALGLRLRRTSN